jgi:hypothetical protein
VVVTEEAVADDLIAERGSALIEIDCTGALPSTEIPSASAARRPWTSANEARKLVSS